MRYSELIERIQPPAGIPAVYYHGTDEESRAQSILQHGIAPQCQISMGRTKTGKMIPVADMIYLTPSIGYAQIYAIGGNMAGSNLPDYMIEKSRYGYVFALDSSIFNEIQPDEDEIGHSVREAYRFLSKAPEGVSEYATNPDFDAALQQAGRSFWNALVELANRVLTSNQIHKMRTGYETADEAAVGKKLVKVMPPDMKARFIMMGSHIAHHGTLMPVAAYRIDKSRSIELKRDGSNFFEIAEKV